MKCVLALAALLIALPAKPQSYLKQKNVDKLGLYVRFEPFATVMCPFSEAELTKRLEAEFLKLRVVPDDNAPLILVARVECMKTEILSKELVGQIVMADVRFATVTPDGVPAEYMVPRYDNTMIANQATADERKKFALDRISSKVTDALMDYLKANLK